MEYTYSFIFSDSMGDETYWQPSPFETNLISLKTRLGKQLNQYEWGSSVIIAECILINSVYHYQPILKRHYPRQTWTRISSADAGTS